MEIYVNDKGVYFEDGSLTKDDIERDEQNFDIELMGYKYRYSEFPVNIDELTSFIQQRVDRGIQEGVSAYNEYQEEKEEEKSEWQSWSLDTWGGQEDGWQVNDRARAFTFECNSDNEKDIEKCFEKEANSNGYRIMHVDYDWQNENLFYVNAKNGKYLFEVEKIK